MSNKLVRLYQFITASYDLSGINNLCFRLVIDFDDLKGHTKSEKAQELILRLARESQLQNLIIEVKRDRPNSYKEKLADFDSDSNLLENLRAGLPSLSKDPSTRLWVNVPSLPSHFIGRESLVSELVTQLTNKQNLALSAEGLPGVGKTALAVALAHDTTIRNHFSDGILWAALGSQGDPLSALSAWGDALGVDVTKLVTPIERNKAISNAIGQRRMLLVIDDAWELETAVNLRCGGPNCCHLLTTRDKGIANNFVGTNLTHNIPTLAEAPALELLTQLAPEACKSDPDTAQSLVKAVGGLPLALELLGGYLNSADHPERFISADLFSDLSQDALTELTDPKRRLELASVRLGGSNIEVTLQETITLSLEGLSEHSRGSEAVQAFYALGAFAPKPALFSLEAAKTVAECDGELLALLLARNLLEIQDKQLTLHQTLANVAQTKMESVIVTRHREYYLSLVNEDQENWQRIEKIYDQIQWAWQFVPEDDSLLLMVIIMQPYQERRGIWDDYLNWAQKGLNLTRKNLWREYEGIMLNNIGLVYIYLENHEKALENFNQSLTIMEEVGDRRGFATTLNNIGGLYHNCLNKYEKALDYYNQALPIREEVGDISGLANTLTNIGLVHSSLKQYEKALDFHKRSLSIKEKEGNRPGIANSLSNIGGVYYFLGQHDRALEHMEKALSILEEVGHRYGESVTRYFIAMIYRELGQYHKAVIEMKLVVGLDKLVQRPSLGRDIAMLAQVEAELAAQK